MKKRIIATVIFALLSGAAILAATQQQEPDSPRKISSYLDYRLEDIFTDKTPRSLADAAADGDLKAIEKLVSSGVNINTKGTNSFTPLFWALRNQNKKGYRKLLELGADPNVLFDKGSSVVEMAVDARDPEYLELALKHGGNPNLVDGWSKNTPLFRAISHDNGKQLEMMIKAGANVNFQEEFGYTPIYKAANISSYEAVYRLLLAGADWKLSTKNGGNLVESMARWPLTSEHETYEGYMKTREFLEKKGVDFSAVPASTPSVRKLQKDLVESVTGYHDTLGKLFPTFQNPNWKERGRVDYQLETLLKGTDTTQDALISSIVKDPGKYNPLVLITAGVQAEKSGNLKEAFHLWNLGVIRAWTDVKILTDKTAAQGFSAFQMNMDFDAKEKFNEKAFGNRENFQKAMMDLERILKENPASYERHWAAGHGIKFDPKAEPQSYMLPESEWKKMDDENLKVLMKSYE